MALSAGTRLGPYEILAPLGAGGMGEVYRATDTKLGREVAIKTLPPEVTGDSERLDRFQREAHLLASLNHPHIAAIYGLEEANGKPLLVLELVEGEDLAERLKRGAIPVDEALEIARQIADGLEEAHDKGIVHRDLKPANVKLTPDGKVKVLDFGLAKAYEGGPTSGGSSMDLSQSPTLAHSGTQAGVILGTAAYMSPEQASGKAVDKRADIWSFGVLLFEMLTGPRLFTGETASEVLASVIKEEPSWEALPPECPPALTKLLRRCLRKRPRERLQDIGDARLELEEVLAGPAEEAGNEPEGSVSTAAELRRLARQRWTWAAVAFLSTGLAALLAFLYFTETAEPRPAAHFVLDTPDGWSFGDWDLPIVSPDGRHVAFAGRSLGGSRQLWIRPLESPEARSLAGTEDAAQPFWSPDGRSIAFFAEGELKKLTLASGTIQRICSLPGRWNWGGTWSGEGTILLAAGESTGEPTATSLFSVSAAGGEAKPLTAHDASRGETGHWDPWFLPDGNHFLFVVGSTHEQSAGIHVASIDAPDQRRRLLPGGARVVYAAGHLLSVRDGVLLAQPLDTSSLEMSGEPVPVAQNVSYWAGLGREWGRFSASPSQILAYRAGGGGGDVQLVWLNREGERLEAVGEPGPYRQIALSPDERQVALEIADGEGHDLWIMDVARGVASRVTTAPGHRVNPVWSPGSQELAFATMPRKHDIHRKRLQVGASATPLLESAEHTWPEDWSRDGKTLLYVTPTAIWALPLSGEAPPELVLETGSALAEPRLSPDGRWLAYISSETGDWEVYVEPYGRPGDRVRVSVDGGGQPKWREDGKELFYVTFPGRRLMSVEVREGGDRIEVGLPTELFELDVAIQPQADNYGVTADGQRFLVEVRAGESVEEEIHVVVNWPALLK